MKVDLNRLLELDRRVTKIHTILLNTSFQLTIRRYRVMRCQNVFLAAKKRFEYNMSKPLFIAEEMGLGLIEKWKDAHPESGRVISMRHHSNYQENLEKRIVELEEILEQKEKLLKSLTGDLKC